MALFVHPEDPDGSRGQLLTILNLLLPRRAASPPAQAGKSGVLWSCTYGVQLGAKRSHANTTFCQRRKLEGVMPDAHPDFVIQILTSAAASPASGAALDTADGSQLTHELQRSLQLGGEIVLMIGSCMARTSILSLSELGQDASFRVGVRFLGISVRTDKDWLECQQSSGPEAPRGQSERAQGIYSLGLPSPA